MYRNRTFIFPFPLWLKLAYKTCAKAAYPTPGSQVRIFRLGEKSRVGEGHELPGGGGGGGGGVRGHAPPVIF